MIPGIRTPDQADLNATGSEPLPDEVRVALEAVDADRCEELTTLMQSQG